MERGMNRIQQMEKSHPKIHDYCCSKLGIEKVMNFLGFSCHQPQGTQQKLFEKIHR
jgi:hypothetical protein